MNKPRCNEFVKQMSQTVRTSKNFAKQSVKVSEAAKEYTHTTSGRAQVPSRFVYSAAFFPISSGFDEIKPSDINPLDFRYVILDLDM